MGTDPPDPAAATKAAYSDLEPRQRRQVVLQATVRTIISLAFLIGIYVIVPPGDVANGDLAAGLLLGIALLVGLVAWEVYRIINAPYPEVRAVTGLLVLVTAVVVIFALTYAIIAASDPSSFTAPMGKGDAVYFTVTTLSTTGFGDITAVSESARWVVTAQMLFDLILLVGLARVFILAAKAGRARRARGQ